jgi:hypothetical protein
MTPESTRPFMFGACNEFVSAQDSRIQFIFSTYSKEGKIFREDFIRFYQEAAQDINRRRSVIENLKSHFVRSDLVSLSDVYVESYLKKDDHPRYSIS